jgi:NAD(P)-dependent dehydrogenase (short-subunit alcohol dehydrogenase family)
VLLVQQAVYAPWGRAGLGLAIAKHLVTAGAKVLCVDRDQSMADLLAEQKDSSTNAAGGCSPLTRPWRAATTARRQASPAAQSIAASENSAPDAPTQQAGCAVLVVGRKSAVAHQPGLPAALESLIEDAIRGDPCSPLRWASRSLHHLVKALAA